MSPILLVLAHPDPSSLNHALAEAVGGALEGRGHAVWFHDLYAEALDPVLPAHEVPRDAALGDTIGRHCSELASADGIVIVHPNWWGQPPAILKGWIDRVVVTSTLEQRRAWLSEARALAIGSFGDGAAEDRSLVTHCS